RRRCRARGRRRISALVAAKPVSSSWRIAIPACRVAIPSAVDYFGRATVMNYSHRFWLYAPLCMFLGLAAWAMGYWWVVASAFDKKLTALNGHEAVPGITVSYASKTISGFPFNIDVVFTGLK